MPEIGEQQNRNQIWKQIQSAGLERGLGDQDSFDVAFHMMDWINDLKRLWAFYENPNSLEVGQIDELLYQFLSHAPHHLAAAKKLYCGIGVSDVFDIGAVETK